LWTKSRQLYFIGLCLWHRTWDPSNLQTSATLEVKPSLLSLDWAPQSDHLLLVGSGGGTVQLFDCNTHRYHWTINSDQDYLKSVLPCLLRV